MYTISLQTTVLDGQNIETLQVTGVPEVGVVEINGVQVNVGDEVLANEIPNVSFRIPPPPIEDGKYRYQTRFLGQPIPTDFTPSQLGGDPYDWRKYGMTAEYVDCSSGWAWDKVGGDWIDSTGTRYGTAAWFTLTPAYSTESVIHEVDLTSIASFAQQENRWLAMLLRTTGSGHRDIHGAKNPVPPKLVIEYQDGTVEVKDAFYSAWMTTSTTYVKSTSLTHRLPAVLEFERPDKPVLKATLQLPLVGRVSGTCKITGFLLDPTINTNPVEYGSAYSGELDSELINDPDIMGVHRYTDQSTRDQFISTCGLTITSEDAHSPDIWNRGERNTNLLPDLDLGKFIGAGTNFKLVPSTYTENGFYPLVEGLGAMEVSMPKSENAYTGAVIDSSGTSGSKARIYMPHHKYCLEDELYVRCYMMWADFDASFNSRYEYRRNSPTGPVVWADKAGKTGITVSSTNKWGFSGSSGGGYGWQLRESWGIRDLEIGAPTGGTISHGLHTFDFGICQPEQQYKYGSVDRGKDKMFGQIGGLGGVMWPMKWYCVEKRVKLNTVMQEAPGYLADGEIDYWIDGRKAFSRRGMVFRTLPLQEAEYVPYSIRPARELGIAYLDFCWYHGGTSENPIDMKLFVTGLAWGKKYIGPMKM